jgi:DNA (cytosine-5)-methyltransferase 1
VEILHAGFPCQDISLAGKGAGIHGSRSGLYREAIRGIEVIRPQWVFFENVPAIVSRGRDVVVADLVALGYSWRDGILSASDVGAPHLRKRWWCLARRCDAADPYRDQREPRNEVKSGGVKQGGPAIADGCADMADPLRQGLAQRAASPVNQSWPRTESSRGGWWESEPAVGRMADGVPHRKHRLRGLGNAQAPLCAAAAWKLLGGP